MRNLLVLPFRQSIIDAVLPPIVTAGTKLVLRGRNLKAPGAKVTFGPKLLDPDSTTDRQIEITLPATVLAGVRSVQVVHPLDFGTCKEPHSGFESNIAAFVVRPTISSISGTATSIKLDFKPPVGKTQRVVLLLNGSAEPFKAYSFSAPPRNQPSDPETTDSLTIPIGGVPPGIYLVRVQVDGAESLLDVDADNHYTGTPKVTL